MIRPPAYVAAVSPYVPGKPIEELERELGIKGSIKLASNENPLGPSNSAVEALSGVANGLNRYPDGGGYYLRSALAQKHDVLMDEIILGNGSNELLDIAARTYLAPGDDAVMAVPSFVVYALTAAAQGARAIQVPLKDMRHDLDAMADAITPKTKIIFIANPNNPTGTINTALELDRMMSRVPDGVLVVLDEAYYEYVLNPAYADSMKHFRDKRDVLVLRTFSKIYGLAGLRVGYGIAPAWITAEMNKLRPPFNTSSPAQAGALAALSDEGHIKLSIESNEAGKKYLYPALDSLGVQYVPTEANFIYIHGVNSAGIYGALLREGVIVRPMGLSSLRVTIGTADENVRFAETLKKVLGKA